MDSKSTSNLTSKKLLPALVVIALLATAVSYQMRDRPDATTGTTAAGAGDENSVSLSTDSAQNDTGSGAGSASSGVQQTSAVQSATTPALADVNSEPADSNIETDSDAERSGSSGSAGQDSPTDTAAPRLSERVYYVIDEAQQMQVDGQWEASLLELNALYADFDSLTPFEQSTLLNFYTNTLLGLEMWQESISVFSRMLTIDDLRPDITARALLSLGQLHTRVGEAPAAVTYFEGWLDFTRDMEGFESQTAFVHRQLEDIRGN